MILRLRYVLHCAYTVSLGCYSCLCWIDTNIQVGGLVANLGVGWLDQMGIRLISLPLKLELYWARQKDWIFYKKLLFLLGRSDPDGGKRLAG